MKTTTEPPTLSPGVIEALSIGNLPDVEWMNEDDLCDCTYQRIGMWKNPYIAETLEVRLCCIWAKIYEQYPEYVRVIPGYYHPDEKVWQTEPWEWNGERPMPRAIWFRHLARKTDRPLAEVRAEFGDKDHLRPKGVIKAPMYLPYDGGWALVAWEINAR